MEAVPKPKLGAADLPKHTLEDNFLYKAIVPANV